MPEPTAAPPTPPIPLASLLAGPELGLRRIAGPRDGDEVVIHMVHTSEMADPYPYLLGGELLLSAGVLLKDPDRYVSRIVQAGAAALGFGVAPVHDTVPAELIEACDRHGLPLIEVPARTTFTAVARAVWRLMAEARHRELRRVTQAQQGLAAAAARPDPVPAVLHQLAARLEGWAVLLGPDGTQLHAAGRAQTPEAVAGIARLARVVNPSQSADSPAGQGPAPRPAPSSATDTVTSPGAAGTSTPAEGAATGSASGTEPSAGPASHAGNAGTSTGTPPRTTAGATGSGAPSVTHLAAYALGGNQGLVLGLAAPAREAGDHTVAGVAVVLLSLLTAPHQGTEATDRSTALVRLLLGASPAEAAELLGPGPWTVVHARGGRGTPFAAAALGAALGSALVDPDADGDVRILLPAGRDVAAQPGWALGVSAPAGPDELAAADTQAARAVRRAAATRADVVGHRETTLTGLPSPDEARLRLAPLRDSPALIETLHTWLSLHGSWDRTATALEVHRNTVRQRIARCAALLDDDLDDPDARMELWFALRYR
ncbi:PucR family transcriptional regulator ligand-binding domain-containing protein [Streptomyces sp. NPDC002889]|uniref:PucR family transcriptional regulator ligand-binding domain-containing protein n=1 Tax=Streptomyces sp. NPDC002889 TaxID=3364669 RepID=UPI0036A8FF05